MCKRNLTICGGNGEFSEGHKLKNPSLPTNFASQVKLN